VPVWGILLIILGVAAAVLLTLYLVGRRMQKKQEAQKEQIEAMKQTTTMLIIDKKRVRLNQSGLPQIVIDQTPKLMRRSKLPIVKAKIGPKIMTLVADEKIYDLIPVKKEVKADVSGIYIVGVRGLRGPLEAKPKKQSFGQKMRSRLTKAQDKAAELDKAKNASGKNKKKK
jgi:type II secretory pathway pseudopilin PulG